jgi:DNA-binding NarL/FixJ family response regulator
MGIRDTLEPEGDREVVGQVDTLVQGIEAARSRPADVALLDLRLLGGRTLDGLSSLVGACPETMVIALTDVETDCALPALRAGARGIVTATAPSETLAAAIRSVARGRIWLEGESAAGLVDVMLHQDRESRGDDKLTPREREVLGLVADGRRNKEIARALGIKIRTVKCHVSSLLQKLGAEDRLQLALYSHGRKTGGGGSLTDPSHRPRDYPSTARRRRARPLRRSG